MIKFIYKLFNWNVPSHLPIKMFLSKNQKDTCVYTWEDWRRDMKRIKPMRYFCFETLPNFFNRIYYKINNFLYYVKSNTYKKQHFLDLRQPKDSQIELEYRYGYCDVRQKMIYANFNLLCEFVEKSYKGTRGIQKRINWLKENHPCCVEEISFLNKVIDLYYWWKFDIQIKYSELYSSTNKVDCDSHCEIQDSLEIEITQKLVEMLSLREHFWT